MSTITELDIPPEVLRFNLRGVDGEYHSLSSLAGSTATVIVFIGNGCPTVRAYEDRLMALQDARRDGGAILSARCVLAGIAEHGDSRCQRDRAAGRDIP